jgi:hypothetical protein
MVRPSSLVVSLVALLAVVVGGAVASAAKPTVAILGLEVIDDGSGIDPKTTQFAKELTEELRKRPKAGTGPYSLAPGSDKDLLEMKLLSGCESEAKDCMAAIGGDLATDRLLYGKIEKRANGYQVSLKLLNVGARTFEKSVSDIIPFGEATGANLTSWGKKLYAKLTGTGDQGTLVITANVPRGTVYVDGQVKGNLSEGTARIAGLSEGKYQVAIDAEGHLRYEANVEVQGGGETKHAAELEKNPIRGGDGQGPGGGGITTGTVSSDERPGGGYRALFWTSLVLTAGSAAGVTVFGLRVRGADEAAKDDAITAWQNASGEQLRLSDACGDADARLGMQDVRNRALLETVQDRCKTGERDALITNAFIGTTAVAAVATIFFYYKGYIASKQGRESANASVKRGKSKRSRSSVVVSPEVTPTLVGAGVRIKF